MREIEVTVRGDAAAKAQHLAVALVAEGIDLKASDAPDQDRDVVTDSVVHFVMAVTAHGAYEAAKSAIRYWMQKYGVSDEDVDVDESGDPSGGDGQS